MALIERHKEKRFGFRVRVMIKFTQRDSDILKWIHHKLQTGVVRTNRLGSNRQTHDLNIRDQQAIMRVIAELQPHIRVKYKQAEYALKILQHTISSEDDLLHVAQLADALSRFNVRSKNRRKNFATKIQEHFSCND
tara:strand:+ start:1702 stop:2109 length:408 start_codon:yes stop_codon:yes gene_type:complete